MELGIGHHGEPGVRVTELKTADEMANTMLDMILPDLPFAAGDEVVALVSGLGATPVMELYILFNKVYDILQDRRHVHLPFVRRQLFHVSGNDGRDLDPDETGR